MAFKYYCEAARYAKDMAVRQNHAVALYREHDGRRTVWIVISDDESTKFRWSDTSDDTEYDHEAYKQREADELWRSEVWPEIREELELTAKDYARDSETGWYYED